MPKANPFNSHLNFFEMYQEFATACGIKQGDINGAPNLRMMITSKKLIQEEFEEEFQTAWQKYLHAPSRENLVELADAIGDSVYVLCQLAHVLDIPLGEVYREIHENNMTKVMPDGTVHRREDGKILKPEGYVPVDLWGLLDRYSQYRARQTKAHGAENWPPEGEKNG